MEYNRTYTADSDQMLPELLQAGERFDLILTDPPYNLKKDFCNNSDSLPLEEFLSRTRQRMTICRDLLKPEGSLIWFGIHHYIGYLQVMLYEAGLFYRRMGILHYTNGFSRSKRAPATQYEPFLWFSRSKTHWTYNADDIRIPYKSTERLKTPVYYRGKDGERKIWRPDPRGALRGDVWEYPTLSGKRYEKERTAHPTQKPEALIIDMIRAFCPKNAEGQYQGTILDPFHGSGTLGVCCEKLNREGHQIRWIGIELEECWNQIAQARLDAVQTERGQEK